MALLFSLRCIKPWHPTMTFKFMQLLSCKEFGMMTWRTTSWVVEVSGSKCGMSISTSTKKSNNCRVVIPRWANSSTFLSHSVNCSGSDSPLWPVGTPSSMPNFRGGSAKSSGCAQETTSLARPDKRQASKGTTKHLRSKTTPKDNSHFHSSTS